MRIAQVAPLAENVPPTLYGGTERVVSWLTEDLVGRGHRVTLFASGDSRTNAELVPVVPRALRLDPNIRDHQPYNCLLLDRVFARAEARNSILFFDEADALFGKRTKVADAHDRFGKAEIDDLLHITVAILDPARRPVAHRHLRQARDLIERIGRIGRGDRAIDRAHHG